MNWVWPMAPAQEPTIADGATSPACRMRSAAISCSSAKLCRRPS